MSKAKFPFHSLLFPLYFVGILWCIKIIEELFFLDFASLGVLPRSIAGIKGIFLYPLIHGDANESLRGFQLFKNFDHLFSNSIPLLILGFLVFNQYKKIALQVFTFIWIFSGLGVWLFARTSYHIGASGIVYGLAFFLFFSGVFRRDLKSIAVALLVSFFYGSMVWGIFPLFPGVSWEGHLFGALGGVLMSFYYKDIAVKKKPIFWDEVESGPIVEDPFWIEKPSEKSIEEQLRRIKIDNNFNQNNES